MATGIAGAKRPVGQSRRSQTPDRRTVHLSRAWRVICGAVFAVGLVVAATDAGKATDDRTATLLAMAPTAELVEATVGNRLLSVIDETGGLSQELQTEIATYYHDNDDEDDDTTSPTDPTKKKKKKKSKKKKKKKKSSKKKSGKKKFKKQLKKSSDDDD